MKDPIEVDGAIVLETEDHLSAQQRAFICAHAATAFPGRRVLVLDGGLRVSRHDQPEWAKRMEAKLDVLVRALAEDEQDDERARDLDGRALPADRDPTEPL